MAVLRHYFESYTTTLEPGARGPDLQADARKAVLGEQPEDLDFWNDPEVQKQVVWYRYLFTNRSRPATHLRF
ncbi:hypothetical protein JF735_04400 [Mycobacterium avium]|uniref:hypothetical protein n=1 Tax=Mycobacterium avium TaxID=1764 RepID=UPI001CDB350A|nr:hypothetical protein [Mycobacterium avium]MCA2292846.1 hypothetical protein [Mycobacterium avium]